MVTGCTVGLPCSCATTTTANVRIKQNGRVFTEAPWPVGRPQPTALAWLWISMDNSARILAQEGTSGTFLNSEATAMEIRRAQSMDASRIVEVINAAFKRAEGYIIDRDRIDLETVQSLFAKGEFLIAEDGGTLAGCVYLEPRGNRTYLGLLSVAPDRQKAGVGSILMRESEIRCAEAGSR